MEIGYPNGDPYVCEGLCPPQLGIELLTDDYFNWSLRSISPLYQFMTLGYPLQVSLPHIPPENSPHISPQTHRPYVSSPHITHQVSSPQASHLAFPFRSPLLVFSPHVSSSRIFPSGSHPLHFPLMPSPNL